MKKYHKKTGLFLLTVFLCGVLTLIASNVLAKNRVDRTIYYQTLNRIKQTKETMTIFVGIKQFTITKETPVLFKRAHKLLKKEVQVIYNKNNYQVINLFIDPRKEPL